MITSSVLIAVFAFVNRSQEQRREQLHNSCATTKRAFIGSRRHRRLYNHHHLCPTALLLARSSFSESEGDSSKPEGSPSPSSSPSSQSKLGSASKKEGKSFSSSTRRENIINSKAKAAPTITATAKKITNESSNIDNKNATSPIENDQDSASIQGLLPPKSFQHLCRIHCTLTLLRKHFPTLLELPALSSSTANWIYNDDVTVTGPKDEQLAVGLEEVLLLSRALATAATAARRAGSLFDLVASTGSSSSSSSSSNQAGQLECELLVDPDDPLRVMALWRTRLPSIGILSANNKDDDQSSSSSSSYTEFSGESTVHLSPTTGLVSKLQINRVKINGVAIIESLGTALAAVRRAARSTAGAMTTAGSDGKKRSSGNPLLDGILNGIQDVVDAVDALPSSEEKEGRDDSPLYVVPVRFWGGATLPVEKEGLVFNYTLSEDMDKDTTQYAEEEESNENSLTYIPVLIDDYSTISGQTTTPVVGSKAFVEYATSHKALESFAKYGLHQLAGVSAIGDSEENIDATVSTETVRSLFATNVELLTNGGVGRGSVTLLRGAGKVADLYRSLALFRESSGGDWKIKSLEADLKSQARLVVCWRTESPIKIVGTDNFIFEPPSSTSSYCLPLSSDGDKEEVAARCAAYFGNDDDNGDNGIPLRINQIENLQLKVAGVTADSAWAQSFVSAALRSGITENAPFIPDATITELLRALTTSTKKSPTTATKSSPKKRTPTQDSPMPMLNDAASANFYRILRALHVDLPDIPNTDTTSPSLSSGTTPAGDFLAETVELRGLLGEVLARGRSNYCRLLSVAISSLRAAIRARTVRLAARPRPTIEVTSKGSIKVNFILALWVNAPSIQVGMALGGGQQQSNSNNEGFGIPLKIEVSSEYTIDETGMIREHRILESRLNGVLTPGDVFSRWIKGLAGELEEEVDGSSANRAVPLAMGSLMDAIAWVSSMQDRK